MKTLALLLLASGCLLLSCGDDDTPIEPPPPEFITETHLIRDVDYVKHTFFSIDDPASFAGAFPYTVEVFLTVTPADIAEDPTILAFPAWAIADSTAEGALIDEAVAELTAGGTPSRGLRVDVRRLELGTDYSLLTMVDDSVAVGIELKNPVPPFQLRTLAVRYRNQLDQQIGGTFGDPGPEQVLILEMIKAPDPRPSGPPWASTWRLEMRNAYDLGFDSITPGTLSVAIEDILNITRTDRTRPEGSDLRYVQIFGLDRRDSSGSGPPDGKIDSYFLGWEHDIARGILWMPTSRAFAPPPERVQVWTNGEFEFSGAYLEQYETSQHIYDDLLNPVGEQEAHQYVIRATVRVPAP